MDRLKDRLKNYVKQKSISMPRLRYYLLEKIESGEITDTIQINDCIARFEREGGLRTKEERRKIRYRKIVEENKNLSPTSKSNLISEINNNKIITENELQQRIKKEEKTSKIQRKEERRKIRYRKIVEENKDLSPTSKSNLISEINNNKIITENELQQRIKKEEKTSKIQRKEERRKIRYRKIVEENKDLSPTSKSNLISEINNNKIITENELQQKLFTEKKKDEFRIEGGIKELEMREKKEKNDYYLILNINMFNTYLYSKYCPKN